MIRIAMKIGLLMIISIALLASTLAFSTPSMNTELTYTPTIQNRTESIISNSIQPLSTTSQIDAYLPARQDGRLYYIDVYTGQSVLCYETPEIISALAVVSTFLHPAQCISVYSYKQDPLTNRAIYDDPH